MTETSSVSGTVSHDPDDQRNPEINAEAGPTLDWVRHELTGKDGASLTVESVDLKA